MIFSAWPKQGKRASLAIMRFTFCVHPSPLAVRHYITPSCLGKKNVLAVCGAVAQRNACYHGCGAQQVHLNAKCQWCRKCRSAVLCLRGHVLLSGLHFSVISSPSFLLTSVLLRLLGWVGAEWEHRSPGCAEQPANDPCCRPNKRKCWHKWNSATLGGSAGEWWNPDRRTRACAVVLLYSQWRYGKDPPGCTAWIQPE